MATKTLPKTDSVRTQRLFARGQSLMALQDQKEVDPSCPSFPRPGHLPPGVESSAHLYS